VRRQRRLAWSSSVDLLAITQGLTPTHEVDHRATLALSRANKIIAVLDPALDRGIGIIYISNATSIGRRH
jgi:hypothetical protein